jgi:lysozyme
MDRAMLIRQLMKDEGFAHKSFWDNKQWTWGFGSKAPGPNAVISKEDAVVELVRHMEIAIRGYEGLYGEINVEINPVRQAALANMVYNLGARGLAGFKNMNKAIRAGNWNAAATHAMDSKWYTQVGKRAKRICRELETGVKLYGV